MSGLSIARFLIPLLLLGFVAACEGGAGSEPASSSATASETMPSAAADARNIVFILVDDHRYDAMGFMEHPYLKTPSLDALASGGVHFANAFVTTSLCSPSRASILSGQYTHHHGVVSNNDPMPTDITTFPMHLQASGYQTGFVGKWHMGGISDEPRQGFDHWVSFRGQGHYLPPENREWSLNINGESVPQKGYITDELTDYALEWLNTRDAEKPFLLYLSHKAVHDNFTPAERHQGAYAAEPFPIPETQPNTAENYADKPMWVYNQRNSWHGVDHPYHGARSDEGGIAGLYKNYIESLLAVDESVGRVMAYLEENGLSENTLILYMGRQRLPLGRAWPHRQTQRLRRVDACTHDGICPIAPRTWHHRRCRRGQHRCGPHLPRSRWAPRTRRYGRAELPGPRYGRHACERLAAVAGLRILLGMEFPPHADGLCLARRSFQAHPIPRRLGHRRTLMISPKTPKNKTI